MWKLRSGIYRNGCDRSDQYYRTVDGAAEGEVKNIWLRKDCWINSGSLFQSVSSVYTFLMDESPQFALTVGRI